MRLGILSRAPNCYSTRRLVESARSKGHEVEVLDTLNFALDLETGHPDLLYKHEVFKPFDAIIPRIGASITFFGTAVVRQYQQMNIFCANSAQAIARSRDKLRSLQILSSHKVGIPKTSYVRGRKDIGLAIERVGGAPLVIKLIEGTQGIGVMLAPTRGVATSILELLLSQKQRVLVQKFVEESKGTDVRAFVVGDLVVAAMKRVAEGDEFRSNVHRGGSTELVKLSPEYERAAVRASQIMGLTVSGVDMLEGDDGPKILEVNSSPGLQGIETCTKIDVAGAVIDHIASHVVFSEIDVRQRLTVNKGYGVHEIHVPTTSKFIGKSITEMISKQSDIQILSLHRDRKSIPNPELSRTIEAGDILVCYGVSADMMSMVSKVSAAAANPLEILSSAPTDEFPRDIDLESKRKQLVEEYERKTADLSNPKEVKFTSPENAVHRETAGGRTIYDISEELQRVERAITARSSK